MGRFITANSRIEQTNMPGYWKTIDNELYLDDSGELILTPRYLWSDGYTFPAWTAPILGDKQKWDVRAAHGHDLFCRFHEKIKVNMSLTVLKLKGYLRTHEGKVIVEDIPLEYLEIEKINKTWADNCFKRMMIATETIPEDKIKLIRFGVFFNLNWYLKTGKKSVLEYNIYEEDIGLVNGV